MRECDLFKAVERAAFLYLFGVLINRVGKLLGKRVLAASVVLGIAVLGASMGANWCYYRIGCCNRNYDSGSLRHRQNNRNCH